MPSANMDTTGPIQAVGYMYSTLQKKYITKVPASFCKLCRERSFDFIVVHLLDGFLSVQSIGLVCLSVCGDVTLSSGCCVSPVHGDWFPVPNVILSVCWNKLFLVI